MLTFLFLVSLTATTVLLLAIAAEEVVRVTRALLAQANDEIRLGFVAAPAVIAPESAQRILESGELRQFPQRARTLNREPAVALDERPEQAA